MGDGARSVAELAELAGVSTISIRRDLTELAEQGALVRTRGGAAAAPRRGVDYPFALRRTEDAETKDALARVAAGLIAPGDSVLIDNGTTAMTVARELAGLGITALALSLHAAAALASKPGNQVIVPGGVVGHDDLAFTSATAVDTVRAMRFDVAIFGACAADPETGLTVADWNDAQIKRAALAQSNRAVLVATADKFARTAAHRFGTFDNLDAIVTTSDVSADVRYRAERAGVQVIIAPLSASA